MKWISGDDSAQASFKRADRNWPVPLKFNICKPLRCHAARGYMLDAKFSAGSSFHFIKKWLPALMLI
jgi:hypothetical protein